MLCKLFKNKSKERPTLDIVQLIMYTIIIAPILAGHGKGIIYFLLIIVAIHIGYLVCNKEVQKESKDSLLDMNLFHIIGFIIIAFPLLYIVGLIIFGSFK